MVWLSLFVHLFVKGLTEVSNNDGNGGATKQLQLPPPAGVSGGRCCWTVRTDRCLPHHREVRHQEKLQSQGLML